MIQINENYRILGTESDYKAEYRIPATEKKKVQEDGWGLVGYYDSIEGALKAIIDEEYRFRLQTNDYDLRSALAEFRRVHNEFSDLLRMDKGAENDDR